jgi:hypothetical protein
MSYAAPVDGAQIFEQLPDFPGPYQASSCWKTSDGLSGVYAWDDFSLPSAFQVTGMTWQGIYAPTWGEPESGQGFSDNIGFLIQFCADDSGLPGGAVTDEYFVIDEVNEAFQQYVDFTYYNETVVHQAAVYDYSVEFSEPIDFPADTIFWVGPVAIRADTSQNWLWTSSNLNEGRSFVQPLGGSLYEFTNDRAFSLIGTIPEPSTLLLMATGCAVAALFAAIPLRRSDR